MGEKKCNGDHSVHMCVLSAKNDEESIKKLSEDPKSVCYDCGRVASCENNLCVPYPVEYREFVKKKLE